MVIGFLWPREVIELKSQKGWMTFPCHIRWSCQRSWASVSVSSASCDTGKSHNLSKHGEIIVPPSWGCVVLIKYLVQLAPSKLP